MGVEGAAIASVISWLVSFSLILYLIIYRRGLINSGHQPFSEFLAISKRILHIGLPAAGANMLTPLAMAILTAVMASYGAHAVAAYGVGARIESIASLVVLALSMTLPPFVSQNLGAGQLERVKTGYRLCIRFVLRLAVCGLCVVGCSGLVDSTLVSDGSTSAYRLSAVLSGFYLWVMACRAL